METTYVDAQPFEIRKEGDTHFIEGICVPYGKVTHRAGPMPEQFERGAFADLLASRTRVKLTDYNHSPNRVPVGYSDTFEDRSAGLWARFRINDTPEGDSGHRNAVAGVYKGLSVGFIARAQEVRDGVRHVTRARLDHVSLVEDPAYQEAEILAVRAADNWLDAYSWMLRDVPEIPGLDNVAPQGFAVAIARFRKP